MLDRPLRFALVTAAATVLALTLADSALARGPNVSIDSSDGEEGRGGFRVRFDGATGVRGEQSLIVPRGTPLRLHTPTPPAFASRPRLTLRSVAGRRPAPGHVAPGPTRTRSSPSRSAPASPSSASRR
jgi:hypothetical protein